MNLTLRLQIFALLVGLGLVIYGIVTLKTGSANLSVFVGPSK
ncbi:MAG: hypothetical protein AB7F59_05290 [Bdellovibrionales bacterium]